MIPLNRLKQAIPLETAEFYFARRIKEETVFKWWLSYTLSSRDHMIASISKSVSRLTHKHGVELSTLASHAKSLDEMNGNTLWMDSINGEKENLKVVFDILD